jgi:hypothetical protein
MDSSDTRNLRAITHFGQAVWPNAFGEREFSGECRSADPQTKYAVPRHQFAGQDFTFRTYQRAIESGLCQIVFREPANLKMFSDGRPAETGAHYVSGSFVVLYKAAQNLEAFARSRRSALEHRLDENAADSLLQKKAIGRANKSDNTTHTNDFVDARSRAVCKKPADFH